MSRARRAPPWSRFPHQLRSIDYVRGLPTLQGNDLAIARRGNKIADGAADLIEQCAIRGIPVAEEKKPCGLLSLGTEATHTALFTLSRRCGRHVFLRLQLP